MGIEERKEEERPNYSFFQNSRCEYFPCHKTSDIENFNCLFCFCPLYALGEKCGGAFKYTETGIKDCSACVLPHSNRGDDYILAHFLEVAKRARKRG